MKAHKIREIRKYSEIVYYDDEGIEIARETQNDDYLYDTDAPIELDEEERNDFL